MSRQNEIDKRETIAGIIVVGVIVIQFLWMLGQWLLS
jgi:hypothetical protein